MAAHTITIDQETFEAAKLEAERRQITVDQMVKEFLATFVEPEREVSGESSLDEPNDQLRAFYALEAFAKAHPFRVDPHSYTRDELHERH